MQVLKSAKAVRDVYILVVNVWVCSHLANTSTLDSLLAQYVKFNNKNGLRFDRLRSNLPVMYWTRNTRENVRIEERENERTRESEKEPFQASVFAVVLFRETCNMCYFGSEWSYKIDTNCFVLGYSAESQNLSKMETDGMEFVIFVCAAVHVLWIFGKVSI